MVLIKKRRLVEKTWYLKLMVYAISLPFIGNTVGWIMTEMGRQPWVVFGVMENGKMLYLQMLRSEKCYSL